MKRLSILFALIPVAPLMAETETTSRFRSGVHETTEGVGDTFRGAADVIVSPFSPRKDVEYDSQYDESQRHPRRRPYDRKEQRYYNQENNKNGKYYKETSTTEVSK